MIGKIVSRNVESANPLQVKPGLRLGIYLQGLTEGIFGYTVVAHGVAGGRFQRFSFKISQFMHGTQYYQPFDAVLSGLA